MNKELLPCPFCGCNPKINLGKKVGCQLHGDPRQGVVISCAWEKCPAKPSIEAGDVYGNGADIITKENKEKAEREAIAIWNSRTVPNQNAIHACKCRSGEEGAMTVKRLDEGLYQCPRCGGIIVPNQNGELAPLDDSFRLALITACADFATEMKIREHGSDLSDVIRKHYEIIRSTFGTPQAVNLNVEDILDYIDDVESGIKYLEICNVGHGFGKERLRNKAKILKQSLLALTNTPKAVNLNEVIAEIRKRWSFDNNQQHTHTWHDREDFIECLNTLNNGKEGV